MSTPRGCCARCAHIKQRCDGDSPCSRCKRLGHACKPRFLDEESALSRGSPARRPRASRSRGGCLPCKTRKKKCDENRPKCSDCRRLNLPCEWPARAIDVEAHSPDLNDTSSLLSVATVSADAVPIDDSDGGPPALSPITPYDDEEFIVTLFPHPLPKKNALPLSLDRSPISANPHLRTEEDRSLFNHYIQVVSRALSRSQDGDRNPFLVTLLPLAAVSDTVTSVILSLSGCHWKRVYPTIWGCALTRQGKALTQVNKLLGFSDRQSIFEACATVLLLCLTELFDGTSRVWKWHLKAASAILKSPAFQTLIPSDEWTFCLSLFHYLDAMSTISRCKAPLLQSNDSMTDLTSSLRRSSVPDLDKTRSLDAIYGISPALFDYLGMVNLLANHRSRRVDELSEVGFRAAADHLEDRIDDWRADYDSKSSADLDRDTDRATTAFEWAIRLRLHQIVEGYDVLHEFVERCVGTILESVQRIPYASRVEGCLLFPLVIAGSSSISVERRMIVKERIMVMENTLGFSHIHHARQLLETVWKGGNSPSDLNWAAVRYSQFPGVVFI
ncbi:hypothetical protein N7508_008324 [Penicillium antarcticum]|uniref:uncharacterized protein n=1 Tax=Penicillium antarcticum TaxID=416450 RepID=UPI0023919271|nr:uncharacterized protein N7508_008324 [Penicillium antarcticum]KAJ5298075.1 hypothetical protein N7508_008324 [Penicillium antarcticum]